VRRVDVLRDGAKPIFLKAGAGGLAIPPIIDAIPAGEVNIPEFLKDKYGRFL